MKAKSIVIIAIILLAVVGAYFGLSSLSIVGTGDKIIMPYTCHSAATCEQSILDAKAGSQEDINNFKLIYNIQCESDKCVGVPK